MVLRRSTRVNILIGNGHFLSHFYSLCLPPLFLVWQKAFGVPFAEVGLAVALMSGTTALMQTPVGFLVDRHGARPFLVGGALLMSLSVAAMGMATSFWQILLLAPLSGLGNSVIHPCDYAILAGSVEQERIGKAFSLHTFSGNLGFAAGPPVMALLAMAIGWRAGLLLVGLLGVPVVLAILLQSAILSDKPADKAAKGAPMSGRALLLSRTMLWFFGYYTLGAMGSAGVQAWLITVLHAVKGMDLTLASTALTGFMVGTTCGVLVGGWLADNRRQHVQALAIWLTLAGAALVLAVDGLALPWPALAGLLFVAGLALGSSRTPRDVMLKEASPAGQVGKVFGFVSAGLPLGAALTPVPFGMLIDHHHPELVLVLVAALLGAGLLCLVSARASARATVVAVAAE